MEERSLEQQWSVQTDQYVNGPFIFQLTVKH